MAVLVTHNCGRSRKHLRRRLRRFESLLQTQPGVSSTSAALASLRLLCLSSCIIPCMDNMFSCRQLSHANPFPVVVPSSFTVNQCARACVFLCVCVYLCGCVVCAVAAFPGLTTLVGHASGSGHIKSCTWRWGRCTLRRSSALMIFRFRCVASHPLRSSHTGVT